MIRRTDLRLAAAVGSVSVLPFVLLELINRQGYGEPFPFALFGLIWLLLAGFTLIAAPVVRDIRVGASSQPGRARLLRLLGLILIAFLLASLLRDQMPCFLGVSNCD